MISYNLALRSDEERHDIELRRQASLLIHLERIGKITNSQIHAEIAKISDHEQEKFKVYLDEYLGIKKIRIETWRKKQNRKNGADKARAMLNQYRDKKSNG